MMAMVLLAPPPPPLLLPEAALSFPPPHAARLNANAPTSSGAVTRWRAFERLIMIFLSRRDGIDKSRGAMWDASGSDRGRLAGLAGGAGAGRGTSGVPSLLGHLLDLVHRDGQDDHRSGDVLLRYGDHRDLHSSLTRRSSD